LQYRFYQLLFSMAFEWTAHRFSGGLLALDLVNTVVCRGDPERRADRFAEAENIDGFAAAAARYRADESDATQYAAPADVAEREALLGLREAVNGWLRPQAEGLADSGEALAGLFAAASVCSESAMSSGAMPLGRAAAVSAMRLFDPAIRARTKICPGCDWLFIDHSKNQSRLWCDMAVCGNRAKAKAHYRRKSGAAKSSGENL
jgi:predicted RNA-binding Zn ribbon-like protein